MHYYKVHVFFNRISEYSFVIESELELNNDDIIHESFKNGMFSSSVDCEYVDSIKKITKEEYDS